MSSVVSVGSIYLSKGNVKEAQKIYFELISRNTENRLYYDMLERCLSLSELMTSVSDIAPNGSCSGW